MKIKRAPRDRISIGRALRSPPIRAKLLGLFFIVIGIYLILFKKDPLYQKIGFGAVFIGAFTFLIITEKTTPKKLNDAQMISNMELIHSIANSLNLKGNGVYIPSGTQLSKERVFIPILEKEKNNIPALDGNMVFITVKTAEDLTPHNKTIPAQNVVLIPPGLELLEAYEKEMGIKIEDIDIDELKRYLQVMIYGLDLINDLSIEREGEKFIKVKIKHSAYKDICDKVTKDMGNVYKQTGCPICSSILCAVTRALGKKVRIHRVDIEDREINYLLRIGG